VTQTLSNAAIGHDWLLRRLFALAGAGVPLATLPAAPAGPRMSPTDMRALAEAQETAPQAPQPELRREGSSGR
jgi:hypothetical protein